MNSTTNIKWNKKGLIFSPDSKFSWMKTHAALPIARKLNNNTYRIFFSTRNAENMASVGFLDLDIENTTYIKNISTEPLLSPGAMGCFDDSGVMAHSIVEHEGKLFLFYTGWNRSVTVPFRWSIGLATSSDEGKTFQKYSNGPIMERNTIDPFFVASPTVIKDNGKWKMWYISGTRWVKEDQNLKNFYHIRYAESNDGINWKREGKISIDFKDKETRIGRASVLVKDDVYMMWYSHAIDNYRIGYAISNDGINWIRKDEEVGIDISESGWDSQMIEYPFVFNHNDQLYMLYNGNNYGEDGFGLAVQSSK